MAAKILSASIARVARALVPTCVFLVWGFGAYGQESSRPGCVIRHAKNGQPYVVCKSEDELKRQRRVIRREGSPSPPPSPTTSTPKTSTPKTSTPKTSTTSVHRHSYKPRVGSPSSQEPGMAQPGNRPKAEPGSRPSIAGPKGAARLRAVRALIEPAEMPPREVAGYGIVAFATRPLPHDVQRYKSVCEAYKAALISEAELPSNTPLSDQMITYWPIANKSTPEARRADCSHLVSNYALRLGLDAIQDADKQNEGLASTRGPFLIAWAPSESRSVPDALVLVMDLSALDSERSFREVFQEWRQKITDNPELWRRGGFNVEAVRRIIRDTFDRYGDGLLRLITKS